MLCRFIFWAFKSRRIGNNVKSWRTIQPNRKPQLLLRVHFERRGITSWQKYFIYKIMILWHKHNKQLLMQIWSIGPSLEGKHFGTKESLYSIRLLLEEGYQSGTACSNPLTGKLLFTRIQISLPLNNFSTDAAVWNRNYFAPSQLVPHQIHQ